MRFIKTLYSLPSGRVRGRGLLGFLLLVLPLALPAQQKFKLEALLPHATLGGQGVAAAFTGQINGTLTIAGGCNFPDTPAAEGGQKKFYDSVWYMGKDQWFKQQFSLPHPTAYGASVTLPGKGIICIGGTDGERSLPDVYRLTDNELKPLPSLPVGIDNAAAATDGKDIYLVGGQTDGKPQMSVYRINAQSGEEWQPIAVLPGQARLQPCAVVQSNGLDMGLYVFGGYDPKTGKVADDVQVLNLKTMLWASHPNSQATVGMTAAKSGYSHVLFFGGVNKTVFEKAVRGEFGADYLTHPAPWYQFNPDILVYHTITDSWYAIPGNSLLARAGAGLIETNGSYILADGESKPGIRGTEVMKVNFTHEVSFGWLNWLVLIIYLVSMLGLGVYFMRRASNSTEDFFKGGGRIPWWAAGISIFATMLSAITYMAIPAKAYATDWTYYPMQICILIVSFPVIKYYLPFFRRLNVTTAYEYLEVRFNAATRTMASVLFIVFMVARTALVLFLPSLAMTAVTGIDIYICIALMALITIVYCTMGGVEAVVWGDVIQGIILVGGAIFAAIYLIVNTGENGASDFWQIATDNDKLRVFLFDAEHPFDYVNATWWVVILGGLANNLISYTSDQTVIQRYLTTSDEKSAARGILTNGIMSVIVTIAFFTIGTGLYTFFKTHPAELDFTMAKGDAIFPFFMMSQMPQGVAGLLIAAIFAATMSTIASNINSVSTAFTVDLWSKIKGDGKAVSVKTARIAGIIAGMLGMAIAWLMATVDIQSLLDYFNTILGLLSGAIGGLFLMGIFFPRIGSRAAITGFICGTATVMYMNFFTQANFLLFGFVSMLVSVVVGWLLSLGNKAPAKKV